MSKDTPITWAYRMLALETHKEQENAQLGQSQDSSGNGHCPREVQTERPVERVAVA